MKCPTCGKAELVYDTKDMPYTYKGKATIISAMTGEYCAVCGETVTDFAESARTMTEMLAFNNEVNASLNNS